MPICERCGGVTDEISSRRVAVTRRRQEQKKKREAGVGAFVKSRWKKKIKLVLRNETELPLYGAFYLNTKSGQWDQEQKPVFLPPKSETRIDEGPLITAWKSQHFIVTGDVNLLPARLTSAEVYKQYLRRIDVASNWNQTYVIRWPSNTNRATRTWREIEVTSLTSAIAGSIASGVGTVASALGSIII